MALKLDISPTYTWPVEFRIAGNGPENPIAISFNAEYKRLPRQRIKEIMAELRSGSSTITDEMIIDEVWVGWDVPDDSGSVAAFTPENRAALFELLGSAEEIVVAWIESLTAGARKN